MNNQAVEYVDFLPLEERVTFKHQETEKLIKVQLLDEETEKKAEKVEVKGTPANVDGDDEN